MIKKQLNMLTARLPAGIRCAIEDADNAVLISAASVWEITTKFRLGKLPEAAAVAAKAGLPSAVKATAA